MYMLYYFIRIAREIFGRRKLQKILVLALVLIAIFFVFTKLGAFAYSGLEGNDDYTDPNNSIYLAYDGYLDDLAIRLNSSTDSDVQSLIDDLLVNHYSFIVMYGQTNQDQNNEFRHMRVIMFNSDTTFLDTSQYSQWLNMNCQICYNETAPICVYDFDNMNLTRNTTMMTFYMPRMLINRYNNTLVEVLSNKTNNDTAAVVSAINETNSKLNQTNSRLATIDDTLSSTDYDEDEVKINTSVIDDVDNSEYTGLFTTIFNSFNNAISSDSIEYLRIPLPNSRGQMLLIPSNLVSRYLSGSLQGLVSAFWYFVFGFYAFKFVNNLIVKIKDGSIMDGYHSSEVITSDMV